MNRSIRIFFCALVMHTLSAGALHPELFFLHDVHYREASFDSESSFDVQGGRADATVFDLLPDALPAWYSGALLKYFDSNRYATQRHAFHLGFPDTSYGLAAGLRLGTEISTLVNTLETQSITEFDQTGPGNKTIRFNQRTEITRASRIAYTGGANVLFRRRDLLLQLGAAITAHHRRGYAFEYHTEHQHYVMREFTIHDYQPSDWSTTVSIGAMLEHHIPLSHRDFVVSMAVTRANLQDASPLRITPTDFSFANAVITTTGFRHNQSFFRASIEITPQGDLLLSRRQMLYRGIWIHGFVIPLCRVEHAWQEGMRTDFIHTSQDRSSATDTIISQRNLFLTSASIIPEIYLTKRLSFRFPVSTELRTRPIGEPGPRGKPEHHPEDPPKIWHSRQMSLGAQARLSLDLPARTLLFITADLGKLASKVNWEELHGSDGIRRGTMYHLSHAGVSVRLVGRR